VSDSVVIAASLAQRPLHGGHAWALLQWVLGFKNLGWRVLLVDRLALDMYCDGAGKPCPADRGINVPRFLEVMRRFELEEDFALLREGSEPIGISRAEVVRRARSAGLFMNVMGFLDDEEILAAAPRRVFLDIDPGFGQMWSALELHDLFAGHDDFATVGLNIGKPGCSVPTLGFEWIPTLPPVVLDEWPMSTRSIRPFTSVATWRGPYDPVEFEGRTYGLRVHEFRQFALLPTLTDAEFELALDIDSGEATDLVLLKENGWRLVDPRDHTQTPQSYRLFIQQSEAEFAVAKGMYVKTRSGWFSDRSACYLASGKPVVAQDTGYSAALPVGDGLLTFRTTEEARAAVEDVRAGYPRHARDARMLAEEHLDSRRVLTKLLEELPASGSAVNAQGKTVPRTGTHAYWHPAESP
jgi:hypothetical protein